MKKTTLTCVFMFIATLMVAQVSKKEKQVLLDFYSATNGQAWTHTWNVEEPVESWYGVTVENNTVTEIHMLFNNVDGILPASLGQLKSLKRLELSFNPISGNIPSELGNMENLEVLALNGTEIQGNIPAELGNLAHLKQLHLSSNNLSGNIPESLGNLNEIEIFNVFDNNLSGMLPKQLAKCPNLKQLMVAENNFNNPDDFSVVLLSNSGAKIDLLNNSPHIEPAQSIIAVERDESED
ncbi:MAG: Two component regulator three Y domain protein [Aequorivita sp.]|nr:Two component regulator three Y domain protein [Aequorivita sp.]MCB0454707.1 Two component regulator three Y domain protein [Aequorivita sp.]MCB0468652.1 Two component regulator three Y domain protein [Aequorivita sp.]HPE82696.1 Two component regulator three Y domain protein [Aequorivita sp.]